MTSKGQHSEIPTRGSLPMTSRKPRGKHCLRALPEPIRLEINCKLRDGWRHEAVAEWLLAERADRDIPEHFLKAGEPYGLIWRRRAHSEGVVETNCCRVICRWSHGPFQDWLNAQPKPYIPPRDAPRRVKKAFAELREELRDNRRARRLLRRLYDAVYLAWPDRDQWTATRYHRSKRPL